MGVGRSFRLTVARELGTELPALGNFLKFITKILHFRQVSAEIPPKHEPPKLVHYYVSIQYLQN